MKQFFELGRILKPQGIKGEVKVQAFTDDLSRFSYLPHAFWDAQGAERVAVIAARTDAQYAYLLLEGIQTRDDAEKLRGRMLYIDRAHAAKLPEGRHYIEDLIGMEMRDAEGTTLGTLKEILQHGAADVYVVTLVQGGTLMFPCVQDVIIERAVEQGFFVVNSEKLTEVGVYDV